MQRHPSSCHPASLMCGFCLCFSFTNLNSTLCSTHHTPRRNLCKWIINCCWNGWYSWGWLDVDMSGLVGNFHTVSMHFISRACVLHCSRDWRLALVCVLLGWDRTSNMSSLSLRGLQQIAALSQRCWVACTATSKISTDRAEKGGKALWLWMFWESVYIHLSVEGKLL